MAILSACIAACIAAAAVAQSDDRWESLRTGLDSWAALSFDAKFGVNVGDENGTLFTWESEGFSMDKYRMEGASLSKWPSAVMISGLVADGTMSYDDKANKYLKWWSKSEEDPRSEITLRHLLSFTSGFYEDSDELYGCRGGFEECAERAFNNYTHKQYTRPGKTWQYLSIHLQLAGAMAVAASGKDIQTLFEEYLYKPFNMTSTTWSPRENPSMAGGITTTGDDFENMLQRLLTYKVLPKEILDQMETDWSKAPVSPSGDAWFGHYGMGHWWECLGYGTPNERAELPPVCTESHIQAGPGEFGFYPLIDRSGGGGAAGPKRPPYYFQVILAEPDALSGIPEYLRIITKPVADVIMAGGDPDTADRTELLSQGAGLLKSDIEYIKSELGLCECGKMSLDEPYRILEDEGQLKDHSEKENRRDIAKTGEGLLLRDLVPIQKKLPGPCKCRGRIL